MKLLVSLAVVITILVASAMASATVIYDEAVQGDIDGINETLILSLGDGLNTVKGSSYVSDLIPPPPCCPGISSDPDTFGFVLSAGYQLNSITFAYEVTSIVGELVSMGVRYAIALTGDDGTSDKTGAIGATEEVVFLYSDGSNSNISVSPSPVDLVMYDVVDSSVTDLLTLPLGPGQYWLRDGKNWSHRDGYTGTWDYSVTFEVTGIAEPGTLTLLGIGLLGMGFVRRCRPG